jgi:zinc protease
MDAALGLAPVATPAKAAPALIVVSGDINRKEVLGQLNKSLSDLPKGEAIVPAEMLDSQRTSKAINVRLAHAAAQYEIGYLVPAPAPTDKQSYAWRIALYALTHFYGGRLGNDAITRRGLVYYIDSAYNSDGANGWITMTIGVDPDKLQAMKKALQKGLADLVAHPPTDAEIADAKAYLIGRAQSAAQSNAEISEELGRQYLWRGALMNPEDLAKALAGINRQDVMNSLKGLTSGTIITVSH